MHLTSYRFVAPVMSGLQITAMTQLKMSIIIQNISRIQIGIKTIMDTITVTNMVTINQETTITLV